MTYTGMPYCHNCREYFTAGGIPNHRKAHLRRGEVVTVTLKTGTWVYTPRTVKSDSERD